MKKRFVLHRSAFLVLAALILSSVIQLLAANANANAEVETAVFAGGCFWCMQPPFDETEGVVETIVGYTGGKEENPTYRQVSAGRTGHIESIEVKYDPARVSYEQLLEVFWHQINPTQSNGQFADIGHQYITAIFYGNEAQKKSAEASKKALDNSGKFDKPIATRILPAKRFWPAEDYHQKYYLKNRAHYNAYKVGSGRAGYIKNTWGVKH